MQYFLHFFWHQPSTSWTQRCARTFTTAKASTTSTASSKQQVTYYQNSFEMQYFLNFLLSAFQFLEAEVCKDPQSLNSLHNRLSLLKTTGNLISQIFWTILFYLNFFMPGLECSRAPCVRGQTTPPTSAFPLLGTWQGEVHQDPRWQLVLTVCAKSSWPPWRHTLLRVTDSFPLLWWQIFFWNTCVKLQILPNSFTNSVATFLFSVQFPLIRKEPIC